MIKLDDNLLQELGLGALSPEEKKKMLAHIYETLEMRVGMELAKKMTDAQLNEFEQFINRNDEAGALRWLETNFPNYKDVVATEFEKLKAEIKQVAPQILASSQQTQTGLGMQNQIPSEQAVAQSQYGPQQPVPPSVYPQQPAGPQASVQSQPFQQMPYQQLAGNAPQPDMPSIVQPEYPTSQLPTQQAQSDQDDYSQAA